MSRFYAFLDDAVAGPFGPEELRGLITRETQVCIEGSDAWMPASAAPELGLLIPPVSRPIASVAAVANVGGVAPAELPPKLRELWLICRNAPDGLLAEQKSKHWKSYFKNEQEIIAAEIARRPALVGTV